MKKRRHETVGIKVDDTIPLNVIYEFCEMYNLRFNLKDMEIVVMDIYYYDTPGKVL